MAPSSTTSATAGTASLHYFLVLFFAIAFVFSLVEFERDLSTLSTSPAYPHGQPGHSLLKHSHRRVEGLPGQTDKQLRTGAAALSKQQTTTKPKPTGSPSHLHGTERTVKPLQCNDPDGFEEGLNYWSAPNEMEDGWESPWSRPEQYVTFETDHGGWNNVRMALELVFAFAKATGRTMVVPWEESFYFPDKGVNPKDYFKHKHGYSDFFPLEEMESRGAQKVLSMDEFLTIEAYTGNLKQLPPAPMDQLKPRQLRDYIRELGKDETNEMVFMPKIRDQGREAFLAIPASPTHPIINNATLRDALRRRAGGEHGNDQFVTRLTDFAAKRAVIPFEGPWQTARVIHFAAFPNEGYRYLTHFYTFLFLQSIDMDHRVKRFIRDHFRYNDEIWCAAERVLKAVRSDARQANARRGVESSDFASYHVRHGDFQFKVVRFEASDIIEHSKEFLTPGELIYIATDETNSSFFDAFRQRYTVKFLDDYFDVAGLKHVQSNHFGMIDTIVASRGRVFIGTWFSTFSGYITRLRGYYGEGMDRQSYYYFPKKKYAMQSKDPPSDPFYTREWPTCWEDIDE